MATQPRASIHPIAPDTWRISVALPHLMPGGFSFNQYLLVDEQPLLFHTGPRSLFELVRAQIEKVMPVERLRHVAFSHFEGDECGSLPEFLAAAPGARPVCSRVAAMTSVRDMVDAEPLALEDGQILDTGRHRLQWQSTPHLPHGWECGYLFDQTTGTLFCGDLFTQPGTGEVPLTEGDILGPSEAFRQVEDYFSHSRDAPRLIEKLAALQPRVLACMHGSAWQGDGAAMLRRLGQALA
ncbi:FprA family A-type flavoprotein [Ottowia sp.]|jgi:flavorubredoxin|uniref:FprA family A-type flavoprotein n=1 Tax=Ottowia sp. TaxID=1898956 RepID=UPI002600F03A|nr:FprA family A-type flavoprotein [Ottowia sp.]MBK6614897.1 MBL fold metallo-hydrolase [Ottowia sp.]MBK6745981.1 MBL fold metallo-hydrolase [Ottowia sp.]